MSTRVPGKRAANKARRSAELEAAGLEELLKHGYAAASVEQIVARAGVARGTFYLYYPNKEALFSALLDRLAEPLIAAIEAARDELRVAPEATGAQAVYLRLGTEIATLLAGNLPLVRLLLAEARSAGAGGEAVR